MLKKLTLVLAVLLIAFSVLFVSVDQATVGVKSSLAASTLKMTVSSPEQPAPTASVTATPKVDYFMAYPGILPDNPIYKLKMVRDRVMLWLTTDPVKKTKLLLLYADKRVGAARALVEGNKVSLGIETLVKGEKYLEKSIWQAQEAKGKGRDVDELSKAIVNATIKHAEIVADLKAKVTGEAEGFLGELLVRIENLRQEAQKL